MDATRGDSRPSAQRLLVWPVVAGSFLFTAIYAALYALLVVRLRLLAPRVPTSDFIVPGFFAVLFGWVVISPRAACLPAKRDDSRFTLVLLVSIIAAVPALFALHYVRESMSRVARVADPAASSRPLPSATTRSRRSTSTAPRAASRGRPTSGDATARSSCSRRRTPARSRGGPHRRGSGWARRRRARSATR